ncbi:MAG: phosphoglucomutase/phosphomannomutase family protein [bacterium]
MNKITFGTDGWRGVIAKDFTYKSASRTIAALIKYFQLKKSEAPKKVKKDLIIVGFDNRFLSPEIGRNSAIEFSKAGFKVITSKFPITTPMVSVMIKHEKALGGIMITASHNPYMYNGIKIRTHNGVSAGREETAQIEKYIEDGVANIQDAVRRSKIIYKDMVPLYISFLSKKLDLRFLKKAGMKLIVDSIYGTGSYPFESILKKSKISFFFIRSKRDPLFGFVNPEPIEQNLEVLRESIKKERADFGIAFDGDADRIGLMDKKGNFINSHQIFALLLLHMLKNKKLNGDIVKTISGSFLIDRISRKYEKALVETPIGFKHISDQMLKRDVVVGGEESGGLGFKGYIEERDGIFAALLVIEYIVKENKPLERLVEELHKQFGSSVYKRKDLHLKYLCEPYRTFNDLKRSAKKLFKKGLKQIQDFDGVKFVWNDDSWLLIRMSGTEPVLRVYAEHSTNAGVNNLLNQAEKLVASCKLR